MTVAPDHAFIGHMRQALIEASRDLADAIREACPAGHSHAYVQHRDRQPAWCEACGYAEDGTLIRRRNPHCSNCGDLRGGPLGHETSECTFDSKAAADHHARLAGETETP